MAVTQLAALHVEVPTEPPRLVVCRRCRRPLRDAESRALRLGPECRDWYARGPESGGEQDALPGM